MTPLPPYPPETSGAPGMRASGGAALSQADAAAGTGLDFAGLLGAALPAVVPAAIPLITASAPEGSVPTPDVPHNPLADHPALAGADRATPPLRPSFAVTIAAPTASLPGGTILPEPGTHLPPSVAASVAPSPTPNLAHALPVHPLATRSEAPPPDPDTSASVSLREDASVAEAPDSPHPATAILAEPPIAQPVQPSSAQSDREADPAATALHLTEPTAAAPPLIAAPIPATEPASAPVRTPSAPPGLFGTRAALPTRRGDATVAMRESEPMTPPEEAPSAGPAPTVSPTPSTTPASAAFPDPSASAPPPAPVAAPSPVAAAFTSDRIDPPRAPAPASAPQLETSIAQVETLREAARTVRPELTLRHAEFGAVSLRLEATGSDSWRAVLASRDPGFVPAIQAALADRAVAAAASASTDIGAFSGQNAGQHPGQNGTSDHRYAASPNGGQAGSQPYLGHSAHRDGEAAPDHRHPSTAAALAARAEEGEEAAGSPARQTRGMFA